MICITWCSTRCKVSFGLSSSGETNDAEVDAVPLCFDTSYMSFDEGLLKVSYAIDKTRMWSVTSLSLS